jgi:hypothetical protein
LGETKNFSFGYADFSLAGTDDRKRKSLDAMKNAYHQRLRREIHRTEKGVG